MDRLVRARVLLAEAESPCLLTNVELAASWLASFLYQEAADASR